MWLENILFRLDQVFGVMCQETSIKSVIPPKLGRKYPRLFDEVVHDSYLCNTCMLGYDDDLGFCVSFNILKLRLLLNWPF